MRCLAWIMCLCMTMLADTRWTADQLPPFLRRVYHLTFIAFQALVIKNNVNVGMRFRF